jgi:hypothetical protein
VTPLAAFSQNAAANRTPGEELTSGAAAVLPTGF